MKPFPALVFVAVLALIGTGVRAGDDAAKQKAVADEWKLRNGTWEPVSSVFDGKESPAAKDRKFVLTYKDDKYADLLDDKVVGEGISKIDPTQNPKTLDIIPKAGAGKSKITQAIYELKGDELRVCLALPPGEARPKDFSAKVGSGHLVLTFKRVKS